MIFVHDTNKFSFNEGITSLHYLNTNSIAFPTYFSKYDLNFFSIASFFLIFAAILSIQESIWGYKPMDTGSIYTIPHLETVAGEATSRSSTSNIMVIWGVRVRI